ncbi:MAG: FAD-dependent oxidoreductase, partial [Proteobacteria bacterium]|nr:FAD-dependent oxidoreductase [Pseudomonadota bacterium]
DPEPMLYHNEPIWRDNEIVGYISSGMYGHTLGGAIGLGYVAGPAGMSDEFVLAGRYEIEVAGARVPATASLKPLYDASSSRVRA